jgi:sec-independent protein translocase protein TatB
MFDIGFTELLLLAVVALVVLGPERLPKAARFAGLWVRRARAQWYSVKSELERELAAEELKRSMAEMKGVAQDLGREVEAQARDAETQVREAERQAREEVEGLRRRVESGAHAGLPPVDDGAPSPATPGEGAHDATSATTVTDARAIPAPEPAPRQPDLLAPDDGGDDGGRR